MSTLLWLLSFALHGVLLYAVMILYTRLAAVKETEKQQKKILEETENTLAAFLLELKEENEKLIENTDSLPSQADEEAQTPHLQNAKTYSERRVQEEENLPEHIEGLISEVERQEESVNSDVQTFEDQVIDLYEQGYSASQIAQKLKSGKTEIELFLKFRAKGVKDS
ncbi:Swarming motility protein SwrB [Bacillus vallismortis]|uniref:Swarming motility protein SwrB n=1 Tax=Bacillus vallismortis TaxID=72361 RepID=A0AAP3FVP3_BACVA|nr:Swarming motility protein SwrB [Bacillus vallismortis]MCY8308894.1 Swarming motility protein SwrB [Bacillus vallismortis]MCY8315244.1 Swarming motility protein SwrB [Bacillus vallismortis]MCY8425623.1 Swarming motility protein SwrB [Bacillus vallismortis]MCY8533195.1 Swarming motility protein SwrB [Bacillus vallismortis]MCY8598353.1 Swarming motility protein SwrB [Bacillus vallismortis]